MPILKTFACCAAMLLIGSSIARSDDFNPQSPPDPQASYRLTVAATPEGVANASGAGVYNEGQRVYINTSARDIDYRFVRWLKNGEPFSDNTSRGFYYTMTPADVTFTAEYEYEVFNPGSPNDPNDDYRWRLFLNADPAEACSFNLNSGQPQTPEDWVTVTAYPSQGFVFDGWYEGGTRVSKSQNFNYWMPSANATLTARFHFVPASPSDPGSTMNPDDIDNGIPGDVTHDGTVDGTDVVALINAFLSAAQTHPRFDITGDGVVDGQDIIAVINIFLGR